MIPQFHGKASFLDSRRYFPWCLNRFRWLWLAKSPLWWTMNFFVMRIRLSLYTRQDVHLTIQIDRVNGRWLNEINLKPLACLWRELLIFDKPCHDSSISRKSFVSGFKEILSVMLKQIPLTMASQVASGKIYSYATKSCPPLPPVYHDNRGERRSQ